MAVYMALPTLPLTTYYTTTTDYVLHTHHYYLTTTHHYYVRADYYPPLYIALLPSLLLLTTTDYYPPLPTTNYQLLHATTRVLLSCATSARGSLLLCPPSPGVKPPWRVHSSHPVLWLIRIHHPCPRHCHVLYAMANTRGQAATPKARRRASACGEHKCEPSCKCLCAKEAIDLSQWQ